MSVGALTQVDQDVIARIRAYGVAYGFGIELLLFGEDASRYATFTAAEKRAFGHLWTLLEVESALDLAAPCDHPPLAEIVPTVLPKTPLKLDENQRVLISQLPSGLHGVARRIIRNRGAQDTISFAEVDAALANYSAYTPAEYFLF